MSASAGQPRFFARVERKEHGFIAKSPGHVDGLVLLGRLVAPPWASEQHPIPGLGDPDLVECARAAGIDFYVDPDTWPLPEAEGHNDRTIGRSVRMAAARVVSLPIGPEDLADPDRRQLVVRASQADQAHAKAPAAPYFRFSSIDDPWLAVNLDCISTLVEQRGSRPVVAFVMGSLEALGSGALELAAPRYATVLPRGSLVFLSVSDFHPDAAEPVLLTRYLLAIEAFAKAGFAPIADRVGDFGPATVPFGARGAARGNRIYRHAPAKARFTHDFNPRMRLKWSVPGTMQRLPIENAAARIIRGTVARCPESRLCVSLTLSIEHVAIRLHEAHLQRHELRAAAQRGGVGQAEAWRAYNLKMLERWAQAMDDAAALSDAA